MSTPIDYYVDKIEKDLIARKCRPPKSLDPEHVAVIQKKFGFYPYMTPQQVDNEKYHNALRQWAVIKYTLRDKYLSDHLRKNTTNLHSVEDLTNQEKPSFLEIRKEEAREAGVCERVLGKINNILDAASITELYQEHPDYRETLNAIFCDAESIRYGSIVTMLKNPKTHPQINGLQSPPFETRINYTAQYILRLFVIDNPEKDDSKILALFDKKMADKKPKKRRNLIH